jgi:hypothetical protein
MSRLCAIAMLCAVVCSPAFATEDELILEEEQTIPAAATREWTDLTPDILEMLDPDSLAEILLTRAEGGPFDAGVERSVIQQVEIVVPLAFFLTILLVVISTLVLRYRRHAQIQETLRLMIEKGAEIPPELLTPPVSQYGDLRRGLILMGAGLSLSILIGLVEGFGDGSWAVGLVPAFIGAGYLIVWRYSQRAGST